jgi:hypothetical protein
MHFFLSCLHIPFWVGSLVFGLAAALACGFLFLHASNKRSSQEELIFLDLWRPLLLGSFYSAMPAALPLLERAHRLHFLKLWNRLMRDSSGDAAERLIAIAHAALRERCPFLNRYNSDPVLGIGSRFPSCRIAANVSPVTGGLKKYPCI